MPLSAVERRKTLKLCSAPLRPPTISQLPSGKADVSYARQRQAAKHYLKVRDRARAAEKEAAEQPKRKSHGVPSHRAAAKHALKVLDNVRADKLLTSSVRSLGGG